MTEMEKLSQNESLPLGSSQRALSRSCSSSRTPCRNSDVDFHDVFGGPPRRRSSIHDVGYDSNESKNSVESNGDDEPLFGLSNEKPVFGDETLNRRRYPSNDFFDDIFRVNEGVSSTPRKLERDPFSSVPGSSVLNPARPLQPLKVENFAQLRLNKGMDFPTFGSAPCSPSKDIASTGISYSPGVVLSRFSNNGNEDLGGNDVRPSYCQSSQSQEFSLSREGSSEFTKSGKGGLSSNSKSESDTSENSAKNSPFHFSIYKWASKGVPLEMPLREVYSSRLKGGVKAEQLSRTDGCKDKENKGAESQPTTTGLMSSRFEQDKPEVDLLLYEITPVKAKPCEIVEKVNFLVPESEMFQSFQNPIKDVVDNTILSHTSEDMKSPCLSEKPEKEIKQARRYGLKPLRSLLFDNDLREGSKSGTAKTGYQKESVAKNTKNLSIVADSRRNVEKRYGKRASAASSDIDKLSCPSSPMNSKDSQGRNKVKGKVKEFVKMYNQETSSKIKDAVSLQSQSSTSKGDGVTNDHISKAQTPKLTQPLDASKMGDEDPKKSLKEHASMKTASYFFNNSFGNDSSASNTGSFRKASRSIVVETDDSFLGDFQSKTRIKQRVLDIIKELPQDETEQSLARKDGKEIEAIDAKIQKWKKGKEGNIRSLLSTLHYVLWVESGWKAVPLVDIIEGNAVKRAYQKALLCLHPDKLQQKGAAPHQKYLAEKVFDTLQESWDYFNSIDRL